MAPDRSKAGGNRNRSDVLLDPRANRRVHLLHHGISSTQNVVDQIGKTPGLIPDGTIVTTKLADDAVTADKIANNTITADQIANTTITEAQLADTAITGGKIANTTITATQLASDAVTTAKINAGAVTTTELGADAVDGTKIADDAIGSEHIADDAVGSAQIADGAVDAARLAAGAVSTAKLQEGAVVAGVLASSAVTTASIADDAVTEAKLADTVVVRADRQVGDPYASLQTTSLTQYYSFTIPGGTLATRTVRVHAHGTMKQNSGSTQNFKHVVRLGGVDMHEASGSIANDADQIVWIMRMDLSFRAAGAQFLSGEWRVSSASNSADGISNIFGMHRDGTWGNNAVAQTDSGDLALTFHQNWATSRTNCEYKVYAINVEYV